MVHPRGVEPPRACAHSDLNAACMPISPRVHTSTPKSRRIIDNSLLSVKEAWAKVKALEAELEQRTSELAVAREIPRGLLSPPSRPMAAAATADAAVTTMPRHLRGEATAQGPSLLQLHNRSVPTEEARMPATMARHGASVNGRERVRRQQASHSSASRQPRGQRGDVAHPLSVPYHGLVEDQPSEEEALRATRALLAEAFPNRQPWALVDA